MSVTFDLESFKIRKFLISSKPLYAVLRDNVSRSISRTKVSISDCDL